METANTNKKNMLLENYKDTTKLIDDNAKAQKRTANSNYEKLLKYLPEYNASRGITGGGAESTLLRAQSNHSSQLGKIDSEANLQKVAAKKEYNDDLKNYYSENYGLAMDTVNNWSASAKDLENYVYGMRDSVSEEQYQSLLNAYDGVKHGVADRDKQKAYTDKLDDLSDLDITFKGINKNFTRGDNFKVTVNGIQKEVQLGEAVQSNSGAYYAAVQKGINDGNMFMYDGDLYYMNGDTVHRVEAKYTEKGGALNQYDLLNKLIQAVPRKKG